MPPRTHNTANQSSTSSAPRPTPTIYEIACTPDREIAMLNIRAVKRAAPMTIKRPDPPSNPLDPHPSLAQAIAYAVLTHYFENIGHSPRQASSLAVTHTKILSSIISARLTAAPAAGQTIALTAEEISGQVLAQIVNPRTDRWVARYSIPRSTGDGYWTVAQAKDGTWGCSCPRYRFKREQCKHIDDVQTHPNWYPYEGKAR